MQKTIVPPFFFIIVADFVKVNEDGQPLRDQDDKPIYERNYFCRRLVNREGLVGYEWDTDAQYVYRFPNEVIANNFLRVELLNLDGARVEEYHPAKSELGALPLDNPKNETV